VKKLRFSNETFHAYLEASVGSPAEIKKAADDSYGRNNEVSYDIEDGDQRGSVALIEWIFVPPDFRGRGLATELLESALEDLDDRGVKATYLVASIGEEDEDLDPEALHEWYLRHGFTFLDEPDPADPYLPLEMVRRAT
jgi:GNAT superfamily N-acetyltransferase